MDIFEKVYKCGGSCGQGPQSKFIDCKNATGIYKVEFNTQLGDNTVNLYDIKFNNKDNLINRMAKITTPSTSFNHAACNCEKSEEYKILNSFEHKKYLTIDYEIKFEITKTNIILEIIRCNKIFINFFF